jgi:hypothetical protein
MKDYNLKRNYDTKHTSKYNDLEGHFQNDKLQQLKIQVSVQQSLLFKRTVQAENSVKVSYLTAEKLQNVESHLLMEYL